MATSQINEVIQHLSRTVLLWDGAGLTDGQLLESFISRREEAAVAALVRRHGPMVWGVCRRLLPSHQDAEDAFQATFLVFLRKAASIMPREMVANWLFGVARQTAVKAKQMAAKRSGRERQVIDMPEPRDIEQDRSHDLHLLLDQELSRLPDKYRCVIVLCDLQGKTRKEAARQLGVPEGTIASRMATARTKLAKRLARHGLAVSGASLTAALLQNVASASVPTPVLASTIKAVTMVAAGETVAAGLISANVAAVTEEVVKSMLLTKLKTMTALLLMLSMVTLTTAMLAWGRPGDNSNSGEIPAAKGDGKPAAKDGTPKHFTNSIGMKFVWIPSGSFLMGSPKEEKGRNVNETQHKVELTRGFYMSIHLVTQEQWKEVMGNNPSQFRGQKNLPVDSVSWDDCQEFVKALRERDKKAYRLPTEAEREFCCRAGTTTPFHFGQTITTEQANYNGTFIYGVGKKGADRKETTPVGGFPANAWGLHDMHGNLSQWCQDYYGEYRKGDATNPQGPEQGKLRVLRGGSWLNDPGNCRSACRTGAAPDILYNYVGLRVCFFEGIEETKGETTPPKNYTNSIGMKFVWIKPGSFLMGSPKEEKERHPGETQHKVTLTKGFYMGAHTVSQEQWHEVMGNNPSHFKGENNLPVEMVSWNDCQEFVKKLREKDKKLYRLPTEAEWEFACRAGTTTPFHFGETISTDQANYIGEAVFGDGKKGVWRKKTTPVGNFPANAWGLHDMHGNVWQWCQDWYDDYPQNDVVDPQGPNKGQYRVYRGGSWGDGPVNCRSAHRFGSVPGVHRSHVGCRLCFFVE